MSKREYTHKDCEYCFRKYFTNVDQCHVPIKGRVAESFIEYLTKINDIKDWTSSSKEEREKYFHVHMANKHKIYFHGVIVPEYRHCRFKVTYPKWYPNFLRFRWLTHTIRFWNI